MLGAFPQGRSDKKIKMKDHTYYVYILSNPRRTVLYIGVTGNMTERLDIHIKNLLTKNTFASKYNCSDIIYFEVYKYVNNAIAREKQLKRWSRAKKENLISSQNQGWKTLNSNFKESDI